MKDEGKLKRADPEVVTMHWKGLCDWDLFEQRLLGAIDGPDPKLIKKVATFAADAFFKIVCPRRDAEHWNAISRPTDAYRDIISPPYWDPLFIR